MPIDRKSIEQQRKKELQDYLSSYPSGVSNEFQSVQNILNRPQDDLLGEYKNKISQYGGQYSFDPRRADILSQSLMAPKLAQQKAQSTQTLDRAKYAAVQGNYNRIYNYAVDNLLNQGLSVAEAEARARQVADDWRTQQFQSEQAQTAREQQTKKSDIANQYQNSATMLQNQTQNSMLSDEIQQAFYRQMLGLGGTIGTGYALGAFGEPVWSKQKGSGSTFVNPLQTVQTPKSLNWRQY